MFGAELFFYPVSYSFDTEGLREMQVLESPSFSSRFFLYGRVSSVVFIFPWLSPAA